MRLIDVWYVLECRENTGINIHILDPNTEEEKTCVTLVGKKLPNAIANYKITGLCKSTSKKRDCRILYDCYVFEEIGKQESLTLGKLVTLWNDVAPDISILQVCFTLDCDCPPVIFNKGQLAPSLLYWAEVKSIFIDFRGRLTVRLDDEEE